MTKIPTMEEEGQKFDKMNRPTSSAYRLAHAVRPDHAETCEPVHSLKAMKGTMVRHMKDHIASVKRITSHPIVDE